MHTGNTPVANGSRVPVWPALRTPSARRTRSTTSCEVGPAGLSTTMTPWMSAVDARGLILVVFGRGCGSGGGGVRRLHLGEKARDAIVGLQPFVVREGQLRGMAQAQLLPQAPPHEAGGLTQSDEGLLAVGFAAEDAHEDAGVAQVGAHLDTGHGHEADPRVLELAPDHARDLLAELFPEALGPSAQFIEQGGAEPHPLEPPPLRPK